MTELLTNVKFSNVLLPVKMNGDYPLAQKVTTNFIVIPHSNVNNVMVLGLVKISTKSLKISSNISIPTMMETSILVMKLLMNI